MATNYGSDSYCLTDIQRISTLVTDPRVVIGQRVARRLQTPRGALALINGDPNFGYDVRQLVNAKLTPSFKVTAQKAIRDEVEKDQEILSAAVRVESAEAGNGIAITVDIQSSDGPFSLVLNVRDLSVEALISFQGQV